MEAQDKTRDFDDTTKMAGSMEEKRDKSLGDLLKAEQGILPGEKTGDSTQVNYSSGWQLVIAMATINLSTLIASLDLGIVATAIPAITADFHGIDAIGWYSGACFLIVGCTSAMWGKMFKYLNVKWVYVVALALYLVGSIVAAAAPNSDALIVGRAIQGWGCSGCLSGSVIIINYTAEPKKRPMLIGVWIGVFMMATILGPLLGGVFTTEVTWRWCFWINLPIGGVALILQIVFLHIPKHIKPTSSTWKEFLLHMDFPGFTFLLASNVCFILALQWGGLTKAWSDGSVIATFVMFIVLTIGFAVIEWLSGEFAMMPLRLLTPRMTWTQCIYGMMSNAYLFQAIFYLPIYFQSIKGTSAIISGVYTLPLIGSFALGAMISGGMVGKTLTIQPFQLVSGLLAIIGAGLLYGLDIDSSKAWYISAQIPLGLGCGLGNQIPVTALQSFSRPEDLTVTTGIVFTFQTLAGSYFIVSAQSIFENKLIQMLRASTADVNPESILGAGASQIQELFTGSTLEAVLNSYMTGVKDVFAYSIACTALTVLLVPLIPFKKLPTPEQGEIRDKEATVTA